jgi:hypothetical protein
MPLPTRPVATAALLLLLAARAGSPAAPLPPLDPAGDRVLRRTVVPDPVRRQGEVRLVARGDARVVQTLLATKVLRRVVAEIRQKEERNWPAGAPGHDDMRRYVAALADAAAALDAAAGDGERRRLLIEMIATPEVGGIILGEFASEERDGRLEPRSARVLATVDVGRDYLRRNMRLVLADAFDVDEDEVDRLGDLGPAR